MPRRMQGVVGLILLVLGITFRGQGQMTSDSTDAWTIFRSEKGAFGITVPSIPHEETLTVKTEKGCVTHNIYRVDSKGVQYTIDYVDLSEVQIDKDRLEKMIKEGQKNALEQFKVKITQSNDVTMGDHPGTEISFVLETGEGKIRTFVVKNSMYQLIAIRIGQITSSNAPIMRFLESFTLLEESKPIAFQKVKFSLSLSRATLRRSTSYQL